MNDYILGLNDCTCINYETPNGIGNCKKTVGKGPICFVDKHSGCSDAKEDEGHYLSWEACSSVEGRLNF